MVASILCTKASCVVMISFVCLVDLSARLSGIPMLCIPHVGDQLAMANQVNELGAGHMIDSCMCNTQTLRAGLVEMAKNYSTYGNAAKRLQGSLQRAPGASGAAMLITQHLR
eukprot:m.153917 g.153917  ORF g.153917 m.153917 type:complete len:112 (+) comp15074_c0_seq8:3176-3511(+)